MMRRRVSGSFEAGLGCFGDGGAGSSVVKPDGHRMRIVVMTRATAGA